VRQALSALETALGHEFRDQELLVAALTHRSFGVEHNERLEFLGDSVLNCAIAAILYERFHALPEGDLSRLRANLVNQEALHGLALQLGLGEALRLGTGEIKSGGRTRPSILADALEALLGAIFLESGFARAQEVIAHLFAARLADIVPGVSAKDAKTRLQEWLQGRREALPRYELLEVTGAAHSQHFHVACRIEGAHALVSEGFGASRRLAEQEAAARALAALEAT
jgi:ribonuclease-3